MDNEKKAVTYIVEESFKEVKDLRTFLAELIIDKLLDNKVKLSDVYTG